MSSALHPGERVLVDRSLKATFIRYTDGGGAVVSIGLDTRIVDPIVLTREEA